MHLEYLYASVPGHLLTEALEDFETRLHAPLVEEPNADRDLLEALGVA